MVVRVGKVVTIFIVILAQSDCYDWGNELNGYEYDVTYDSSDSDLTWYEARAECMSEGGDLASILTDEEDSHIKNINTPHSGQIWIGLKKISGEWRWTDGSTFSRSQWAYKEPVRDNWCVQRLSRISSRWYSVNCADTVGRLCKRKKGSTGPITTTPSTPVGGYCPTGYIGVAPTSDRCYKFTRLTGSAGVTWEDAQLSCLKADHPGATLASITSPEENAAILMQLVNMPSEEGFWIGMSRESQSYAWGWADNVEVTFTYWHGDFSPSDTGCVFTSSESIPSGSWEDGDCSRRKNYICQIYKDSGNFISTPPPTPPNSCEPGETAYLEGCYSLVTNAQTWNQASTTCKNRGAYLVDIHDVGENGAVLLAMLPGQQTKTWIGFHKDEDSTTYRWTSGWYVQYTNWAAGQPTMPVGGGCVAFDAVGEWSDTVCESKLPFMCKTTTADPITPPPEVKGRCPSNLWTASGGHCYKTCGDCQATWLEANGICATLHPTATLASIHNFVDNDIIYKMAQQDSLDSADPYIGLFRSQKTGKFMWIDGTEVEYTKYAPGEPRAPDSGYDCIHMEVADYHDMWVSSPCNVLRGYVCKVAKLPLPTPPPDVPGQCPDERWTKYGENCFLFQPDEFNTWKGANKQCKTEGGEGAFLAKINSLEENDFTHHTMVKNANSPEKRNFWIGLAKHGPWPEPYLWVSDNTNVTFDNWGFGEPDDTVGEENCVQVNRETATWQDEDCADAIGFVCKAPLSKMTESTTEKQDNNGGALATGVTFSRLFAVLVVAVVSDALFRLPMP